MAWLLFTMLLCVMLIVMLHFAWGVLEVKCILVTAVCVSVCLSVCLSLAAFPHYCTDTDVGLGMVVVCCWVDLQSAHGFRCYDNIAPNAKCQRVLVLALCLVSYCRPNFHLPLLIVYSFMLEQKFWSDEKCVSRQLLLYAVSNFKFQNLKKTTGQKSRQAINYEVCIA